MKTQHTAGTWMYKRQGFKITIGNEDTGATKNGHDYTIAIIDDNSFQAEANAKIIAAAPELLETLIGTMQALSRMIDKYNPDDIEAEWIGNANEAIRKATI